LSSRRLVALSLVFVACVVAASALIAAHLFRHGASAPVTAVTTSITRVASTTISTTLARSAIATTTSSTLGLQPIPSWRYVKIMGVGVNVDWLSFGWVERQYFYWRQHGVSIPKLFKERGFDNVRIRVCGDVVSNATLLEMLKEVVNDCLKAGIVPIISYCANELREHPTDPSALHHFVEWWVTVAKAFKGYPYTLSYDLIIETSGPIKSYPEVLNKAYTEVIKAIRSIDRYRIIIVTPANVSKPWALKYLRIPIDQYIIAEWHVFAGGPCHRNRFVGMEVCRSVIQQAVNAALNWSKRTGVPTWVGAWRPNCYPKKGKGRGPILPEDVAIEFSKLMVSELCSRGIPYDVNADTKFFDYYNLSWYPSQRELLNVVLNCSYR